MAQISPTGQCFLWLFLRSTFISLTMFLSISCDAPTPAGANESTSSENEKQEDDTVSATERTETGSEFFADTVKPQFERSCVSCHTESDQAPTPAGPISIFDYGQMKLLLAGDTTENNGLINKVSNKTVHGGENACGSDIKTIPCSPILEWWDIEYGTGERSSIPGLAAELEKVLINGVASGYAASELELEKILSLTFFIGGDKNSGKKIFPDPIEADKLGYSGGVDGDHRFEVNLPKEFTNGKKQKLYIYTTFNGKEVRLKGTPIEFVAWEPKGADSFYIKNADFPGCGCHTRTYEADFLQLGTPHPKDGGTRTNNELYRFGLGSHTGGKYDTDFVSDWWDQEFGE